MGFFDTLGKMINGEPVFDSQSSQPQTPQPATTPGMAADPTRSETGHKLHPDMRVSRVKTSRNGDKMTSYSWVQNNSPYAVVLKKFYVMGQGVAMNYVLTPGQGREVKVYDGRIATSEHDAHAYLDIMIEQNGDYFQQEFHVEFDRQADGAYLIEEFHPEAHVRDT